MAKRWPWQIPHGDYCIRNTLIESHKTCHLKTCRKNVKRVKEMMWAVCVCFSGKQLWEPYNVLSIPALSDGEIGRIISLAHTFFNVAACGLSPSQNICSVFINARSLPAGWADQPSRRFIRDGQCSDIYIILFVRFVGLKQNVTLDKNKIFHIYKMLSWAFRWV